MITNEIDPLDSEEVFCSSECKTMTRVYNKIAYPGTTQSESNQERCITSGLHIPLILRCTFQDRELTNNTKKEDLVSFSRSEPQQEERDREFDKRDSDSDD